MHLINVHENQNLMTNRLSKQGEQYSSSPYVKIKFKLG